MVSFIPFLKRDELLSAVQPAGTACRAIPLPPVVTGQCPIPVFHSTPDIIQLLQAIGQPLEVYDEQQLHVLWTLTGLITPYYDLLHTLGEWTVQHGVPAATANTYVASMFQALSYMAQQQAVPDFKELSRHAATPKGMNEQAGQELRSAGIHESYSKAADRLLQRFPQ